MSGIRSLFQTDLVDLRSISMFNQGFNYLVTCIDVFSKYAWVIPIHNKSGKTLIEAFEEIIKESTPIFIQSDKGMEFLNHNFQRWLKAHKILFYTSENEATKASVVERFNRTLKTILWRYFTTKETLHYLDVLPQLVHSYNNTYHRSIKRTASVNYENQEDVWQTLYGELDSKEYPKIPIGACVRISESKGHFQKGIYPVGLKNYSRSRKVSPELPHCT